MREIVTQNVMRQKTARSATCPSSIAIFHVKALRPAEVNMEKLTVKKIKENKFPHHPHSKVGEKLSGDQHNHKKCLCLMRSDKQIVNYT
jgi:hypothetical protein